MEGGLTMSVGRDKNGRIKRGYRLSRTSGRVVKATAKRKVKRRVKRKVKRKVYDLGSRGGLRKICRKRRL